MDRGTLCNLLSAAVSGAGLLLPGGLARDIVLSMGLFAFSGGIMNTLAIKLLFDRIPGLVRNGVIPRRFQEIRAKMKDLILEHFFSEELLRAYLAEQGKGLDWKSYVKPSGDGKRPAEAFIEKEWTRLSSPEAIDSIVDEQIEKLMDSSLGGFLMMVSASAVKPAVHQFLGGFLGAMKERASAAAAASSAAGDPWEGMEIHEEKLLADIRLNVERLLERKLRELDASAVKGMMEDVLRKHLDWLVVWGNVFGAALGIVAVVVKRYYL